MAGVVEDIGAWLDGLASFSLLPSQYNYIVRMISWFFLTLGLACSVPIALLIVYDFLLWLWRLARIRPESTPQPASPPEHEKHKQRKGLDVSAVPVIPFTPASAGDEVEKGQNI